MLRTPLTLTVLLACTLAIGACAPGEPTRTEITVRLWDAQVAKAYERSFALFEEDNPDIDVDVELVPWSDYWSTLRTDAAAGRLDDIFWTNSSNIHDFIAAGAIGPVSEVLGAEDAVTSERRWAPAVVRQYSFDGELWGVPQLMDLGIGLLYNADALDVAGIDVSTVNDLSWDPTLESDPLRATATALTLDVAGRHPDDPTFDRSRIAQYGYSASNDLNAHILSSLGSNGATWQDGERFAFASPQGIETFQYLVDLINTDHVAPPASDTNPPQGSEHALDLFLQGRLALFQTGPYHLATIAENSDFDWGIAPLPAGPTGAVTPTNGIVAAASASTTHPSEQERVLRWMGSDEGSRAIGAGGAALPAVLGAQEDYFHHWEGIGVDVSPMLDALDATIPAPTGIAYAAAQQAYEPILNEVFSGDRIVGDGVRAAEKAANDAGTGR